MKKLLISFALAAHALGFSTSEASAQSQPLVQNLAAVFETVSYHFDDYDYNEFNPGIGAEYRWNRTFHAGTGVYRNSFNATSVYFSAGAETNPRKFLGAGAEAGIITGYNESIIPSIVPYVRIGNRDKSNMKISVIPPIKDVTPAVMAAQVRIPLHKFIGKIKR